MEERNDNVTTQEPVQEKMDAEKETLEMEEAPKSIYELLEEDIMASEIPDAEKTKWLSRLIKIRSKKVNVLLVGATGSGKSSTINAMFNMDVAKVGVDVEPETSEITKYELDNLVIWDSPGLGDGVENDKRITKAIISKLNETDKKDKPVIDLVLVVLDASSKDLGTSYDLINNVLIPCLGEDAQNHILIGLNQSDMAMKGKHWNVEKNEPDEVLLEFLKRKAASVQQRIKDGTGLDIEPIYYCAGYKEDGGEQCKPYNLTKLLYHIVKMIPKDKRLALADHISEEEDNWRYDDEEEDYRAYTRNSFCDAIQDGIADGAELGGAILGLPGKVVGGVIGGAVGFVKGLFGSIFS